MPKKEGQEHTSMLYVKAASLEDLCRYACTFDYGSENLLLTKGKSQKLVAMGERVGNAFIGYYIPAPKAMKKTIKYTPGKGGDSERVEFGEIEGQLPSNTFGINVIGIDISTFESPIKVASKDIAFARIDSAEDLIKAIIKKAIETETLMHVYAFTYKGKRYISTFDLFKELEDDRKLFYYSLFNNKTQSRYARYNYNENKLEYTDSIGEHSYMYVKIINLAEPYPFFNPMPE